MGTLLNFSKVKERKVQSDPKENKHHERKIVVARALITRASTILSDTGADTERVGWLLEECREMLTAKQEQVLPDPS